MSLMLGRPMTTDSSTRVIPPLNCHVPEDFLEKPPIPIGENERPCAFNERLLHYRLSIRLPEMRRLGAYRPFPKDPTIIDSLHRDIISLLDSLPAYFRQQNPDTTWDVECAFIPIQREFILCSHLSYLLTLHRVHVSTIANSRLRAIEAATGILDSQHRLFKKLKPQHYKNHHVMFFTFDASVNLATILLSTPSELWTIQNALERLGQAIGRLEVLAMHTSLSKSALVVIRALYQQLQRESYNSSVREAELIDGNGNFHADFLEEYSRNNGFDENSALMFDPALVSFDPFDPAAMETSFDAGNNDLMTFMDPSIESSINAVQENIWMLDGDASLSQ